MPESDIAKGLQDVIQKAEGSLIPAIQDHVESDEFNASKDGLDFLDVKNSLLLSYMIDLTFNLQQRLSSSPPSEENVERLTEMKVSLGKIRPLEKKMRYQLDKLLSKDSESFVSVGEQQRDPLSFRPDLDAMKDDDDAEGISSEDDDEDHKEDGDGDDDDDDDLAAAKATVRLAREKNSTNTQEEDGIYRAPRLSSMPYPSENKQQNAEEKRRRRRMRTSELAQTLRDQYGEAPEQEDVHGGSNYGKQREAARRLAEREEEKTRFEEDQMIRLTKTRKEKKERKRLLREESSNLTALTDLGNLARGVSDAFQDDDAFTASSALEQHSGKKKGSKKRGKMQAKNSFQEALYGKTSSSKKKKKR